MLSDEESTETGERNSPVTVPLTRGEAEEPNDNLRRHGTPGVHGQPPLDHRLLDAETLPRITAPTMSRTLTQRDPSTAPPLSRSPMSSVSPVPSSASSPISPLSHLGPSSTKSTWTKGRGKGGKCMKIVGNRLMKERLSKEDKLLKVQMWRDWIAMRADSIRSLLNKTK